jgi:hypothetical protein
VHRLCPLSSKLYHFVNKDHSSREHLLQEQLEKPSDSLSSHYDYFQESYSLHSCYQADESNEFESISLLDDVQRRQRGATGPKWFRQTKSKYVLSTGWWEDEH